MNINAHWVRKITATAHHTENTHWIELTIYERSRHTATETSTTVTLFTEGPEAARLVDDYVAAINSVKVDETAQSEALEAAE